MQTLKMIILQGKPYLALPLRGPSQPLFLLQALFMRMRERLQRSRSAVRLYGRTPLVTLKQYFAYIEPPHEPTEFPVKIDGNEYFISSMRFFKSC